MASESFIIDVPQAVLDDLNERLDDTRWPDEIPGSGWDYGSNLAYIQELVAYWRTRFDWRAQERLLNAMPQFKADVDGLSIHFVHQRGKGPNPFPLIMIHGWPGSFFEMYKVLGPLTDPAAHGGDPADAFDLVVPSLPGYGFSGQPRERGMHTGRIAGLFAKLMSEELGYRRFGSQGGDWGASVTTFLGARHADVVAGIHLNMVISGRGAASESERTEEEKRWLKEFEAFRAEEMGYATIQGTKPQTLSYGLNDSPAGLCAWIVEKFRRWSDCDGDVERSFTKDELLTNVMIYWVTQTIGSSVRLYYESFHAQGQGLGSERVEVPTGVAVFPKEIVRPPRSTVERAYNLQRWTEMPAGGHFAALEEPEALVEDIRAFFRPLRG
ncbi:MAG: epoxide hydrolase [Chloroflexi bacterium]|nr:epoxide hydrolase [Chloroflexota bacterium]